MALVVAATTLSSPSAVPAQGPELRGRALLGTDSIPLSGAEVSLHRVGRDTAGVVDVTTAGPDGRFLLRIPPPDSGDLFLATVRYEGVLYFGPPFHEPARAPSPYVVMAYPARPLEDPSALTLSQRHLVVSPAGDRHQVLDVAAAANDSAWTWTAAEGSGAVWRLALPDAATEVSVDRRGVSRSEVRIGDGRAEVAAAVPPGGQRLVLRYELPPGEEVSLFLLRSVGALELLVADPGMASVAGLEPVGTLPFQGREYRRYGARDLPAGATVAFSVETGGSRADGLSSVLPWSLLALGAALLAAAAWVRRRLRGGGEVRYRAVDNRRKGAG